MDKALDLQTRGREFESWRRVRLIDEGGRLWKMSISDIEANWELKWYFTKFKETKAIHTTLKLLLLKVDFLSKICQIYIPK